MKDITYETNQNVEPVIGQWYMTATGKLIKVIMIVHNENQIEKVIIGYLTGDRKHLSIEDWKILDLNEY